MKYTYHNNDMTIHLDGRIDTNNSNAVQAEIDALLEANPTENLVLDCNDLDYISSSGLRIILRLRKRFETLRIVGVQTDVYEIFDMTGFTELMTIERAYKRLSVEGCEVIGQGANGKVYRLSDDIIVKAYLHHDCLPDIQRERDLAKKAFVLGIPTAISYEIAKIDDGYGSVFELLDATSLAKMLSQDPGRLDECVDLYVDLLKIIHSTTAKEGDMPDMKEIALSWAKFDVLHLPEGLGDKLFKMVEAVPKCNTVLHGDYHIKNVMVQNGEALLIDMDTLCLGHPIFELGSMYNAYLGFPSLNPVAVPTFMGISYELSQIFWKKSLGKYLGTDDPVRIAEVSDKAAIVGYMRLLRRSLRRNAPQHEIDHFRNQLVELLNRYDTLLF